jgi:hypothetical protein
MKKIQFIMLAILLMTIAMLAIIWTIPMAVIAQDLDVGTPPVVITPGEPFRLQTGEIIPTLPFSDTTCYTTVPLLVGDLIYIKPGVNIRSESNGSSAIVWNTDYNQVDENGERLFPQDYVNMEAFITGGPICSLGYNWWQIDFPAGIDGWISEGRPTDRSGYLFQVPGIDFDASCDSPYDLVAGEVATITQNVRVREAANTSARVVTVAPLGSEFVLLEGPECDIRTRIAWFRIQITVVDFTYDGWIAQGQGGAVWLLPTDLPSEEAGTLCGIPLNFSIGDVGYVDPRDERPRNLRDAPGVFSNVLFVLVDGVPFQIIGGPTCVNNLNWWQIRVLSSSPVDGWIAEGSQGVGYWLSETASDGSRVLPDVGEWTVQLSDSLSASCPSGSSVSLSSTSALGITFARFSTIVSITGANSFTFIDAIVTQISDEVYSGDIVFPQAAGTINVQPIDTELVGGEIIVDSQGCTVTISFTATKN